MSGMSKNGVLLLPALFAISLMAAPDGDVPKKYEAPTADQDYVKRDVMIAMRDGVTLHTVSVVPKGAKNAPI